MQLFISWILLVGVTCVSSQILLYSSKAPKGKHPGLYGGNLITTGKGEIQVNEKIETHCYHADNGLKTDMQIKSISVDDWTRSILMLLEGKEVILLKGHTCQVDQMCTNSSVTVLIDGYGTTDDIGPFAMHNGEVYFVNRVENVDEEETTTHTFEVRKINFKKKECLVKDYPITAGSLFTVEDCTDFAGHLLREYQDEKIKPLDIALVNVNGEINSIVSMESKLAEKDGTTRTYTLNLVVTDRQKKETSHTLKTVNVWKGYSIWAFESLGGVAYQNGRLCWSALNQVICWKYETEAFIDEKLVLAEGESKTSGACSDSQNALSNITTGVAFIEKEGKLDVFFGCLLSIGGAGVVTMKGDSKNVYPLRTNTSTVFASAMAIADDCLDFTDKAYTILGHNAASSLISISSLLPHLLLFIIITLLHRV